MTISAEWAKQLAFFSFGKDLDFAGMKVLNAPPNIWTLHVPMAAYSEYPGPVSTFNHAWLDMEGVTVATRVCDTLNREYTYLGYGPKTNTLVVFGNPEEMDWNYLIWNKQP